MPVSQGARKLGSGLLFYCSGVSQAALACDDGGEDHLRGQRVRMGCAEPGFQAFGGQPGSGQRWLVMLLEAQGGGYVELADEGVRVSRPQPSLVTGENGLRFRYGCRNLVLCQQVDRLAQAAGQRVSTVAAKSPGETLSGLINMFLRLAGMPIAAQCHAEQDPRVERAEVIVSECVTALRPDGLHLGGR